jgi:undecaprenyl-diphosphatase
MDTLIAALLGLIQGTTEFLPISSSGHLVLFQHLFDLQEPALLFDTTLHLGTLTAVMVFFAHDIKEMALEGAGAKKRGSHSRLLLWVIVATVPTGIIGIAFKKQIEGLFQDPFFTGMMLVVTGLLLLSTRFLRSEYNKRINIGIISALAIGISQGIAIIPGISRSGATIACGLFLGLERELAGRFSFLLSIPAILGAIILQLRGEEIARIGIIPLAAGFFCAAVTGLLSLKFLMGIIKTGRFYLFAPYCWLAGIVSMAAAR